MPHSIIIRVSGVRVPVPPPSPPNIQNELGTYRLVSLKAIEAVRIGFFGRDFVSGWIRQDI